MIADAPPVHISPARAWRLSRHFPANNASRSALPAPVELKHSPAQSLTSPSPLKISIPSRNSPFRSRHAAPHTRHTSTTAERVSRPVAARETVSLKEATSPEGVHPITKVPPVYFTAESADRLMRPTAARSEAMAGASERRKLHSGSVDDSFVSNDGEIFASRDDTDGGMERRLSLTVQSLDSSSHLLQGTAVSEARKTTPSKPVQRPPVPRIFVSGVSDRLMSRTATNQVAVEEGPAKARERLRQKMLDQQRQQVKPAVVAKPKYTVEDGIVKARERLRARQLQQTENQRVASSFGHGLAEPGMAGSVRPPSGKRILTVPQGPKFSTSTRHVDRPTGARADIQTLAQSLNTFGKGLRDDMSASAGSIGSFHRNLTIPTSPKFATDSRCGEKYKSPRTRADVALAQSMDVLQNGLRTPYYAPPLKRTAGPTKPHSPKFHKLPHRARPMSTAEKEVEEMEYFNSHPFKAKTTTRSSSNRRITISSTGRGHALPSFMQPTKSNAAMPSTQVATTRPSTEPRSHRTASLTQAPFHLASSSRSSMHSLMTEASRRRTEQLALEREMRAAKTNYLRDEVHKKKQEEERSQRRRQAARHAHLQLKYSTNEPQPFRLASLALPEAAREEEARRKLEADEVLVT